MSGKRWCASVLALAVCVAFVAPGAASAAVWSSARTGPSAASVGALDFATALSSLTNSGRLATDNIGEYAVWLFPGQTIDLQLSSGSTGADFYLMLWDDSAVDPVAEADNVEYGTEHISYTNNDSGAGAQVFHIVLYAVAGGNYTLRVSMTDPPVNAALERLAGGDRYATAVEVSKDTFAAGAGTVVIASGANFPDALAAAGLCGVYDAPLLLVPTTSLPAVVSAEVDRLNATDVIIVGGTGAVSPAVASALASVPGVAQVDRIAGASRYETAKLIAEEMSSELGTDLPDAFVVSGTNFADALAVSPLAYAGNRPILLTPKEFAHEDTLDAIDSVGVEDIVIVGGTGAVGATAEQQIEARLGAQADRWAGLDRFGTACLVADNGVAAGLVDLGYVGVANGRGFADGLGGGVAAGSQGGVLVLTECWIEPEVTEEFLVAAAGQTTAARVFGGSGAVWGNVLGMVDAGLF